MARKDSEYESRGLGDQAYAEAEEEAASSIAGQDGGRQEEGRECALGQEKDGRRRKEKMMAGTLMWTPISLMVKAEMDER